jgi:hypothetical protein
MATPEDIQAFIHQQRAHGAFDSSGTFSVDMRKARAKADLAAGNVPGLHALRLVQAATLLKFTAIHVRTSRIVLAGDLPMRLEEVREALQGTTALPERGQRLFVEGLRHCLALAEQDPVLRQQRRGRFRQLNLVSGIITEGGCDSGSEVEICFARKPAAPVVASEAREIELRCGFCPIVVGYEGREVGFDNGQGYRQRPPCVAMWNNFTHPSYLLALEHAAPVGQRTGVRIPDSRDLHCQIPNGQEYHSIFFYRRERGCLDSSSDRTLTIPLGLDGPNLVKLVHTGVVVETVQADLGVAGAQAVACVDHLQTDLSGLQLVHDEPYREYLRELRSATLDLARAAGDHLDQFKLPRAHEEQSGGLLARLMNWAFSSHQGVTQEDRSADCIREIRNRLP